MTSAEQNEQQAIKNPDPVARRKHAREVAAILWKAVPQSSRSNVIAIRGYETVFSTDPDVVQRISRKLIDTFPGGELQEIADQK
jgi:hypothetical protein